ncbi:hypothetical protein JM78_23765 [Burkholderia pyrrocinia]|uniref:hypothetical protein n=1 Tax=Burkholderia pyrrocinia TaxID=60550 RepID=UPI0005076E31|nr:hypothetical protein [Burkholderia pyrrocinia]KFL51443.1 hypothetical protein JM78_23765 [Burkholderia pyrrocinia]
MKKTLIGTLLALAAAAHAATKVPVQLLDQTGSASGQSIVSTGPSTAPMWGNLSAGGLAPIAANTVLANPTGSSASPTAFAMPGCSGANSALRWTAGTGFTCASGIALTSSGLNQFAPTTSAQLAGAISDETGTGTLVFNTNPTLAGATFSAILTPSSTAGIKATSTNDDANAGSVGEFPSPSNLSGVSLTSGAAANISSISLGAGDWDIQCVSQLSPSGATNTTAYGAGISITSGAYEGLGTFTSIVGASWSGTTGAPAVSTPVVRKKFTATTTVYCVSSASFSGGTMSAAGVMRARRPR